MSANLLASAVEFAENPGARCPCVLLLDVSGSTNGEPIDALNAGLRAFKDDLSKDSLAARRVEVALVACDHEVVVHHDFSTIDNFTPPHLTTREGLTQEHRCRGGLEGGRNGGLANAGMDQGMTLTMCRGT